MFFLKPKHKSDEILPPPPPFPTMEFEEEKKAEFFEPTPKKAEALSEEKEFSGIVEKVEELNPKKTKINVKKKILKKAPKQSKKIEPVQLKKITPFKQIKKIGAKQKKLRAIKIKKITQPKQVRVEKAHPKKIFKIKPIKKIIQVKPIKEKIPLKKIKLLKKIKTAKEKRIRKPELKEDFGLKGIEFELPEEFKGPEKEIKLPEKLEDFDIEDAGKELESEIRPKEILEAEEEIKNAIEKIKSKDKPSFFNRLFSKKEQEKIGKIYPIMEIDYVSTIQNNLKIAREALSMFDLKTARMSYIEIMKIYNRMKPEEQAKVYRDIKELYFERKSAEELEV